MNYLKQCWSRIATQTSANLLFLPITLKQPEDVGPESASEGWFGLKAYIGSGIPILKVAGWLIVISLSTAAVVGSTLAVIRLTSLWDLWFEGVRLPDVEPPFQRSLRIITVWLAVFGISLWLLCKAFYG